MNDCQHTSFETHRDIGFDISCDYEEKQHMDICTACKARRFWRGVLVYGEEWKPIYGEWEDNTPTSFWNNPMTMGQFS